MIFVKYTGYHIRRVMSAVNSSACGLFSINCVRDHLPVLYHDKNFIIVNKSFDLKVNSDDSNDLYTVATILRVMFPSYFDEKTAHGFRFVHRLDYATSGCLCVALTKKAARQGNAAFASQKVTKHYLALVRGHVDVLQSGLQRTVSLSVGEEEIDVKSAADESDVIPNRMCTADNPACRHPRTAETSVTLLEHGLYDGQPASKVLLVPRSGRRHQLRVHCASLGHHIVGDYTYSNRKDVTPYRMMLHAYRLVITTPLTSTIDVTASDPFTSEIDPLWRTSETFLTYDAATGIQ